MSIYRRINWGEMLSSYNQGQNSLEQSCKTSSYQWFDPYSQRQWALYFQSLLHVSPPPLKCNVEGREKLQECVFDIVCGVGREGQATCTLHLVRIFVLSVFKEPQVHNNNYCFKIFVHDCRFKKRNRGSCLNLI